MAHRGEQRWVLESKMLERKWTFVVLMAASLTVPCRAQSATDQLQPLVETSARRLVIARQVALAKWDTGAAVEDPTREAKVIAEAVKAGESQGLQPASVADFFRAQIEANKVVQYALLADWHRAGKAPAHPPVNLVETIRPQLDQLQTALITELKATTALRATSTCPEDLARSTGTYVTAHKNEVDRLQAIALDRALGSACTH